MEAKKIIYKPIRFIVITYVITWLCAYFQAYQIWFAGDTLFSRVLLMLVNFIESASPLLAAIFLLRTHRPRSQEQSLLRFFLGRSSHPLAYAVTAFLFIFQFLSFFLFRRPDSGELSATAFFSAWMGQILLGGGMEEGGWRGYLQPALEQKMPAVISVAAVALVWACWHLPYFFLPDTFLNGGNFLFYVVTATGTAFTLTAIYKMTGSVLLCTLFHGWQNAIVMNVPADMEKTGFLVMFALQTMVSVFLCVRTIKK